MANWTNEPQPFGANRAPLIAGVSSVDGVTPVPVAVDPATGRMLTNSTGGGGGADVQYTEGSTQATTTGTVAFGKDGSNVVKPLPLDASGYLEVNVKAGSGSGLSVTDEAAWTAGSSNFVPGGGVFNDSATALTAGQEGTQRLTANRAGHSNLRDASGNELGIAARPVQVSLANTGSNSTAVKVDGTANNQPVVLNDNANSAAYTGLNSSNVLNVTGYSTAGVELAGSWVATIVFEAQIHGGDWFSVSGINQSTGAIESSATANGNWRINVAGCSQVRIRCSAYTSGTINTNLLVTGGADGGVVKTDGSAFTQPVSGTVTANAGTGTFAVSAASLPLPTGAATAANQTNGTQQTQITDGTNAANVLKSDGTAAGQNSALTANAYLPVSFSTTTAQAVGSTDAGNYASVAVHITGQGTSSTITFQASNDNTNWTTHQLWNSASVNGLAGSTTAGSALFVGPIPARYFRLNVTGISAGTTAGVIVFSSKPFAPEQVVAQSVQNGTWTVQPGNTANTTPWLTTNTPATSGGYSIYRLLSAASTNGNNIKASAGQVFGWYIANTSTSLKYVKLYNKATAPTVGTDTPVMTIPVPANTTASGGAGTNVEFMNGIAFGTGIGIGITGAVADNDTTAVAANDCVVNLFYK